MRETYTAIVVRIDEALKNLKEDNLREHLEIRGDIKEFKLHVNEEILKIDIRVKKCEDDDKTAAIIYKVAIGLLSIALTISTILGYLKVI